jgi:hypothetical protein
MKRYESLVLEKKSPGGAQNFIPVNAKYHAEERCEKNGVVYDEKFEKKLREMANDVLSGSW